MSAQGRAIPRLPDGGDGVRTLLVLTVDTEEDGRWGGKYPRDGHTCENIEHLGVLDPLLEEFGVKPTWLMDYPVASSDRACVRVQETMARWGGEIGAHLHPWCNPPFTREDEQGITYAGLMSAGSQRAKLETLTSRIESSFGSRPITYRAGRWGLTPSSVQVLHGLSYTVDTSVTPLRWEQESGGPSFLPAPAVPYFLDSRDVCLPGNGSLLEIPASLAMIGPVGRALEPLLRRLPPARGLARAMDALGRTWLRPSFASERRLRRATSELVRRRFPVLNVMFHSSELMPGGSPYVRDTGELHGFLRRLRAIFEAAFRSGGVRAATLREARERLLMGEGA